MGLLAEVGQLPDDVGQRSVGALLLAVDQVGVDAAAGVGVAGLERRRLGRELPADVHRPHLPEVERHLTGPDPPQVAVLQICNDALKVKTDRQFFTQSSDFKN